MAACSTFLDDLERFNRRLRERLTRRTATLTTTEGQWLKVFDEVAARFEKLSRDESYGLSLCALWRCIQKGKGENHGYLKRACINEHLNFLKVRRRLEFLWPAIFEEVAAKFGQLSRDESYELSFRALDRCRQQGRGQCRNYLRRACINEHLAYIRLPERPRLEGAGKRRLPLPLPRGVARDPWVRIDTRLDLEGALRRLGEEDPRAEAVLRMRLENRTHKEIAERLGVTKRHATRLTNGAEERLRCLLCEYEQGNHDSPVP